MKNSVATKSYDFIPTRGSAPSSPTLLYGLEPIGIGTPLVESMSSYLTRLAAAHTVPLPAFVKHLIGPLLHSIRIYPDGITIGSRNVLAGMNESGKTAAELVSALEEATGRQGLRFTTMLPFSNLVGPSDLTKTACSWCSHCFEEMRLSGSVVYVPLLWCLKPASYCPRHDTPLQTSCPFCGSEFSVVQLRAMLGFCAKCTAWLGSPANLSTGGSDTRLEKTLGKLLEAGAILERTGSRTQIQALISHLVMERVKLDGIMSLSRLLKVSHYCIRDWLAGKGLPRISHLVKICQVFKLDLMEVLTCQLEDVERLGRNAAVPLGDSFDVRRVPWSKVHAMLYDIVEGKVAPVRIADIGRAFGCHAEHVYNKFPELCREASARHKAYHREQQEKSGGDFGQKKLDEIANHFIQNGIFPTRRRLADLVSRQDLWIYPYVSRRFSDWKAASAESMIGTCSCKS